MACMQLKGPRVVAIRRRALRWKPVCAFFFGCTIGNQQKKMSRVIILLGFVLVFVAVAIRGGEIPAEFKAAAAPIRAACIAETGAANDMIEKSGNGDFTDDDKLKCYFKCVMNTFKLVKGDNIDFDLMLTLVPTSMKDHGEHMVRTCRDTTGSDICDKSYNVMKCFHKANPEIFFVI